MRIIKGMLAMADFMHLQGPRLAVSLANAAINLLLLACWTVVLLRRAPRVSITSPGGTA